MRDAGEMQAGYIETAGNGSSEMVVSETGAPGGRNRGWALINFFCLYDGR